MNDITKKHIEDVIRFKKQDLERVEDFISRTQEQLEKHTEEKEKLLTEIKALEQDLNK